MPPLPSSIPLLPYIHIIYVQRLFLTSFLTHSTQSLTIHFSTYPHVQHLQS
jgi:hypothetical protein